MTTPTNTKKKSKPLDDYNYVSAKNWQRKQNIQKGNDKLSNLIGRPGIITGIIVTMFDMVVTFILKIAFNLMKILTFAFDWVYNISFGNFSGIIPIPQDALGGTVISLKYFRYTLTVLMPPFGILLSKGLYGWFSILVCMLITYVNFFAGIIYAFIITSRNRYSDQYEKEELKRLRASTDNSSVKQTVYDISALLGTCGFLILIGLVIFLCLSIF